jgi:hypothetical protein
MTGEGSRVMAGREDVDLSRVAWRKSGRSTGDGSNCVEVACVLTADDSTSQAADPTH